MVVAGAGRVNGFTAVVAARMPLVRVGLAAALDLVGVTTVAKVVGFAEAIEVLAATPASLLVLGEAGEATADLVAQQVELLRSIHVVALIAAADRRTLVALLEAGVDAVALQSVQPEALGSLADRVLAGERPVDPILMPVLVDMARDRNGASGARGSRWDPPPPAVIAVQPGRAGDAIPLTSKELQVLGRLAHGASNADIAAALFVSTATIKTHLAHIYVKLGVGSRHGATSRAAALGLVPPGERTVTSVTAGS